MKKLYFISSILYSILGLMHTVCTPIFYKVTTPDGLWFAGTGFGLIFLGFFNIASIKLDIKSIFNLCIICNIIYAAFNIYMTIILFEPQAFIGVIFILILLTGSVYFIPCPVDNIDNSAYQ